QLQFYPRHCAGRRDCTGASSHDGTPCPLHQNGSRHHLLRQSLSGRLNMASGGIGTPGHVAGELFKVMTGVNLVHVPYRGEGPALTDAISGQVQLMFVSVTPSLEFIRAGKLRAVAVSTAMRSPALPDVPTIAETVPGYEANGWAGMGAPKGTPSEIIEKLNSHINAGLVSPAIKARYADLGIAPLVLSPAEFGKFVADDERLYGAEPQSKMTPFAPDSQIPGPARGVEGPSTVSNFQCCRRPRSDPNCLRPACQASGSGARLTRSQLREVGECARRERQRGCSAARAALNELAALKGAGADEKRVRPLAH